MRALSRIVAGLVLIFGTLVIAATSFHSHTFGAWRLVLTTWAIAIGVFGVGALFPREQDERVASYVVPAVGAALLLPITIHMPVLLFYYGSNSFDSWCMLSVIFVGIAHLTFAVLVGRRAAALARGEQALDVRTIYGVTVAMSGLPGIVIVVPVLLTAVTALPILPLLHLMPRWCQPGGVPRAIARTV